MIEEAIQMLTGLYVLSAYLCVPVVLLVLVAYILAIIRDLLE